MMAGEAQSDYDKNRTSIEIESSTNSHFSDLIQRLMKMAKNPSIESDLSQTLDEFLQKLNDCEKFLEHGIFTMNFAEAALLLQSSADIYSKKVDLLWDIIFDYQKRILLSDDQNKSKEQELENLEERKRKYKRKRQSNENQTRRTKLVNQFSFDNPETFDYLNQTYEKSSVIESWEKINTQETTTNDNHTGDIFNKNYQFLPNDSIYNEDNEYLGRYDQFHSASLIEDIFTLEETHDFNVEKQIPNSKVMENYLTCESSNRCPVENFYRDLEKTFSQDTQAVLDKLPSDLVQKQQLRRCSLADSLFEDDHLSSISDNENSTTTACDSIHQENKEIGAILCNQILSSGQEQMKCSEDIEVIPYDQIEASIEERRKYIEDNGVIPYEQIAGSVDKRNKSCSQDSAFFEFDDSTRGTPFSRSRSVSKTPNVLLRQPRNVKRKSFVDGLQADDLKEEIKRKRKKGISAKMIKRLSSGVTANYREFEKFCRVHYKSEENEGTVPPELTDSEDSDDNAEDSEEEDEEEEVETFEDVGIDQDDDEEEEDENVTNELHQTPTTDNLGISTSSELPETSHEPLTSTPTTSRVAEPSERTRTTALPELTSEDLEAEEISRNNVKEWRTFILPIIKKMDAKSDFDIHEYGSNIIEPMKIGEERRFKDIVAGKNAAEVARYFIATLQLANTNNVEITGAAPGQVANETFNVKALDKTRHHELLEDYQAPSEETFRERLERAKAMNPHKALHSTPFQPPPVKKTKVACYSRKKLY